MPAPEVEALFARKQSLLSELNTLIQTPEQLVDLTGLQIPTELDSFIAFAVQDQHLTLTDLSQSILFSVQSAFPELGIDLIELRQKINAIASRKCYGIKTKGMHVNEDNTCLDRWMWEVNDLNLLPCEVAGQLRKLRKSRKLVVFCFFFISFKSQKFFVRDFRKSIYFRN